MKNTYKFYLLAIVGSLFFILYGCKKVQNGIPTISTTAVSSSNITSTTIKIVGNVPSDGGATVSSRGICWSLFPNSTGSSVHFTYDGDGTGDFTSTLTGLRPGTTYYIRTYATNSFGTVYGPEIKITTLTALATITTEVVSKITSTTVTCGGYITDDGGTVIIARGVCWSLTANPTIANNKTTDGTSIGKFVSTINNLTPGSIYYIKSYATNNVGTAYGDQLTVTIDASIPTLTTDMVTNITVSSATSGGSIISDGGARITARGICWSLNPTPTIADNITFDGNGNGSFVSKLKILRSRYTYYIRSYATNIMGTGYGEDVSFTTLDNGLTQSINDFVPQDIIDEMIRLGMPINKGNTPPNIEGAYLMSPNILAATDVLNDYTPGAKFDDITFQFSQQNNSQLTINADWLQGSNPGSSMTSYIIGSGNKFTVVVNSTFAYNGIKAIAAEVYSGTIEATGIRNIYHSFFMIENNGNGAVISNGTGRVFYDGDGFSEKIPLFKSAQLKGANTSNKNIYWLLK